MQQQMALPSATINNKPLNNNHTMQIAQLTAIPKPNIKTNIGNKEGKGDSNNGPTMKQGWISATSGASMAGSGASGASVAGSAASGASVAGRTQSRWKGRSHLLPGQQC
ncbi:unnamed protein product [Polarella glacialis]|uniref:Uncharacterized protein n=1 Tax=Polarella glacialis TaxID=89957 RepID=A0A813GT85_POLGL|nr:unnamed protein product [Polarella glacialis]CAE8628452.1 unnamed protein product [Polarella glacialis]